MKTISEINHEVSELLAKHDPKDKDTREYKKASRRAKLLRTCAAYLEFNPSTEVIKRHLELVEKKIKQANDGYEIWYKCTIPDDRGKNPKQTYRNEMDLKTLELQQRSLNYLLSEN